MRIVLLFVCTFLLANLADAQTKPKSYPYQAQIIGSEVQIYDKPSFDAKIIGSVQEGQRFDVSSQIYGGAFYRIRVKPGLLGYVSDADVKPLWVGGGVSKPQEVKTAAKKTAETKKKKSDKRKRPFEYTQFAGIQFASIEYQEATMGDRRKQAMGFFGAKLSGPNLVVDGAFPTEVNFLFHLGAPDYYERLTGHTADGWIFLMNFLWESYFPAGKNALSFIGFGPLLRYSKFNASLTDSSTGRTSDYSLEDIGFGAVFNAGMAVRIDQVALRGELQYYWEKQTYWGAGLSILYSF
jgi:hypothetical protein